MTHLTGPFGKRSFGVEKLPYRQLRRKELHVFSGWDRIDLRRETFRQEQQGSIRLPSICPIGEVALELVPGRNLQWQW